MEKESTTKKGNNPNTQKIPNNIVNEPIPCIYGPPDWYKKNRNSDKNHSFAKTLKRMIQQIKNIKHNMSNILIDEPIPDVYGPMPPEDVDTIVPEDDNSISFSDINIDESTDKKR